MREGREQISLSPMPLRYLSLQEFRSSPDFYCWMFIESLLSLYLFPVPCLIPMNNKNGIGQETKEEDIMCNRWKELT